MADLKRYRDKRDPARTPEPFGGEGVRPQVPADAARAFVVQQHAARSLHWDLRLEIGGVLVSWAVPRGPSLDPAEKRLAVQTEDHPLEYQHFEGVIPEGNYGAGAMIVWDRGAYHCIDGVSPAAGLEKGKLDLLLEGHKLRGRFALVRTKGEGGRQWLLLRKGDPPASDVAEIIDAQPESVLSGLRVEELRDGATRSEVVREAAARLGAPRRAVDGAALTPMLAETADEAFSRDGWVFELKYDGMRALATRRAGGEVTLHSRTRREVTASYPEIVRALQRLPAEQFVLDGEIVSADERGRPSFARLQQRFGQSDPDRVARLEVEAPAVLHAFDLLGVEGHDLRRCALIDRKALLASFVPRLGQVRHVDHVEREGRALFELAAQNELEGIIAKRADARYEVGRRASTWLKVKNPRSSALVVVGTLPGKGSRARLGSLMLAWHGPDGALRYAGNVGSGLSEEQIDSLLSELAAAVVDEPAFEGAPEPPARGTVYVRPVLVVEVRYTEVTAAGQLRHPVFVDAQPDRPIADCVAPVDHEAAADVAPQPRAPAKRTPQLQLTRLDKVFWPEDGYTKGDLLAYYEAAWPHLAPYLRDRPVVLTRYPDGIEGKSFFQKNAPDWTPEWALHETIEDTDYYICNDLRTLLHVINSGAIPLHIGSARRGDLEHPDWLILDLDPKGAPFAHVVQIARHAHRLLEALGVPHFPKTSGQDGLHVFVPLGGQLDQDQTRLLAEVLARLVADDLPEIATVARPIAARGDRVYVDALQNGRGKLIAAPFSVRPRTGAPISMPLRWSQVTTRLDPTRFTIRTGIPRIEKGGDPWQGMLEMDVDLSGLLGALSARVESTGSAGE